jgi:hypothetical protein
MTLKPRHKLEAFFCSLSEGESRRSLSKISESP